MFITLCFITLDDNNKNWAQKFDKFHPFWQCFGCCTVKSKKMMCKKVIWGGGNCMNNVLFSILPSPSLTMTVKLLGRERETTQNVLFSIIPSPHPFKDCKVIGEGGGNHGQRGGWETRHYNWYCIFFYFFLHVAISRIPMDLYLEKGTEARDIHLCLYVMEKLI